jgi:DNA-binding CsgD family transcriptional regulator
MSSSSAFAFLGRIDDRELREEIRGVLRQMQLLSESRASAVSRSAPSSEEPDGPPGFEGLSAVVCPPEERSLFEHFLWRFDDAVGREVPRKRLWFLLWDAEHALKTRVVPPSEREREERVAMVLSRPDEDALKRYVLANFEGEHAYRVHLQLKLPQGWIEKVREDDRRDPDYGFQRPRWLELSTAEKTEQVRTVAESGCTQKEAVRRLGVSLRTVKAYWPRSEAA